MTSTPKHIPQAEDAEAAVLGACMLDTSALPRVENLRPSFFYSPKNQAIFEAMLSLSQKGMPIDILTVKKELQRRKDLDRIGGVVYLNDLQMRVASSANIEYHAAYVRLTWAGRELLGKLGEVQEHLHSPTPNINQAFETLERTMDQLVEYGSDRHGRTMREISLDFLDELEMLLAHDGQLVGITSGLRDLDLVTGGWREPDLNIVAARPGMGKTDFGLHCVYTAAKCGYPAAFISLEMRDTQLFQRLMSMHTRIAKSDYSRGNRDVLLHNGATRPEVMKAAGDLTRMGIYLEDAGDMGPGDLRRKCRELVKKGVKFIVIDYLGLVRLDYQPGRNKTELLGEVSRMLKVAVAKEMQVPVMALHQLSRSVEQRGGDKRPIMSDLRDSGNLEQDADSVSFLYRPEYYGFSSDENGESTAGMCEIILSKNRHGPTGRTLVSYQPSIGLFQDYHQGGVGSPITPF